MAIGIDMPRDASQQVLEGEEINWETLWEKILWEEILWEEIRGGRNPWEQINGTKNNYK